MISRDRETSSAIVVVAVATIGLDFYIHFGDVVKDLTEPVKLVEAVGEVRSGVEGGDEIMKNMQVNRGARGHNVAEENNKGRAWRINNGPVCL